MVIVRPEDVRAFVDRDWGAQAELKERFWLDQKRRYGLQWALQAADELRRQVIALRPGWPSLEERDEDLAVHARVAAVLRRVARASSE
jgi:hypothetical protein